jgi:hypothetical protein
MWRQPLRLCKRPSPCFFVTARSRASRRLQKHHLAQKQFDGPHVWDKLGLSGYLVCLVHLVSLMQPNKPDRPNRPNEQDRLTVFFSILFILENTACP